MATTEKLALSAPWVRFYREIKALLEGDEDINVVHDEEAHLIKIYVANNRKADALEAILPSEKTFGNITIRVEVIPANYDENKDFLSLFKTAFEGNPAVSKIVSFETPVAGKVDYVMFRKEVVQFFNDDLQDPNGNESTLYQNIAKDVFEDRDRVFFCTDSEDPGAAVLL